MATLSTLTQNRAQALIGDVDATLPGEFAVFAVERGKRAIVDVPFSIIAALVIWTQLLNAGTWSLTHLPFVGGAVLAFFAFYDGRFI